MSPSVAHDRVCRLGQVIDGESCLHTAGHMVHDLWEMLPQAETPTGGNSHITLDAFVAMPNRRHGIVTIQEHRPGQG